MRTRVIVLLLTVLLTACAGKAPVPLGPTKSPVPQTGKPDVSHPDLATGLAIVRIARKMLGSPYHYGGSTPRGFDCSGLVSYAHRQAGIQVPRSSAEQYREAREVSLHDLQPGDLLFFRLQPPKVSHVGIYDRNGRFIHAPSSGKKVSYAFLATPYWREHLIGAGRFR